MAGVGPVIEGKLVRLRPPKADDAPQMITWFEDMEVTRFVLRHHPPSLDEEKEWLEKMARDPDQVIWVVEHMALWWGSRASTPSVGRTASAPPAR